ncbi:MAG: hypothetical protein WC533_04225 [Candidatus Pacearchaeota archaeon]
MVKFKEVAQIFAVIIVLIIAVNLNAVVTNKINLEIMLIKSVSIAIIVVLSIIAKNIAANYFEAGIKTKIWQWQRFGIQQHQHFKKPVPAGIILPLLFSLVSIGYFYWFACLEFDATPKHSRVAKRYGIKEFRFTEMTESHLGFIAAAGVVVNLIASVIAYIAGFPEFTKLAIYYSAFSMLPLSNLDGNKIFFASIKFWITLAAICLIFLGYALYLR